MKRIIRIILLSILTFIIIEYIARISISIYKKTIVYDKNMKKPVIENPFWGWFWNPTHRDLVGEIKQQFSNNVSDKNKITNIILLGNFKLLSKSFKQKLDFKINSGKIFDTHNIINFCPPNFSSYQTFEAFKNLDLPLNKNIFLLMLGREDRRAFTKTYRKDSRLEFLRHYCTQFFETCKFYESVFYNRDASIYTTGNLVERVNVSEFTKNLSNLINFLINNNAHVILLEQFDNPKIVKEYINGLNYLSIGNTDSAILELEKAVLKNNILSDLAKKKLSEIYLQKGELEKAKDLIISKSSYNERDMFGGYVHLGEEYNLALAQIANKHKIPVINLSEILKDEKYFNNNQNSLSNKGLNVVIKHISLEIQKILHK